MDQTSVFRRNGKEMPLLAIDALKIGDLQPTRFAKSFVLIIALLAMWPMLSHAGPKPVNQRPIKVAVAISQHVCVFRSD